MKNLTAVLKAIFVPFYAFLFLILGILACFCSAIIEYMTLYELLKLPGNFIRPDHWAALIVLVLEGSKITLHFYSTALKKAAVHSGEFHQHLEKWVNTVKNGLILLSFICTMIFFTNVFYLSSQTDTIAAASQQAEKNYQTRLEEEKTRLKKVKTDYIKIHSAAYDAEREQINTYNTQYDTLMKAAENASSSSKRKLLQAEAESIRDACGLLQTTYAGHIQEVTEDADDDYNKKLKAFETNNSPAAITTEDLDVLTTADNPYLSRFLLAFTETFFHRPYGRIVYFCSALLISLFLSGLLEACISISQHLLNLDVNDFIQIIGELPPVGQTAKRLINTVLALGFSVLISAAVYLICGIVLSTNINVISLIVALVTYAFTWSCFSLVTVKNCLNKNKIAKNERSSSTAIVILEKIVQEIRSMAIPAALAFIGYTIIGFLFSGTFQYGDLNGLAIAVGGIVSQKLSYHNLTFSL